jgi:hypothetical protein
LNQETVMAIWRLMAWTAAAFAAQISTCDAGPCATAIDRVQSRIDAALEAKAGTGQGAVEGAGALMHRQPTPNSIAAAEETSDNLPAEKIGAVEQAMARARAADAAGDNAACEKALADVKSTIGP